MKEDGTDWTLEDLVPCEEDRHLYPAYGPYVAGWRWFRSPNVIPIERYWNKRRSKTNGK